MARDGGVPEPVGGGGRGRGGGGNDWHTRNVRLDVFFAGPNPKPSNRVNGNS